MIEYGITDEWNVQMRTSKNNCDHWVVTMETQWLPCGCHGNNKR